jgi:hypothetical protein
MRERQRQKVEDAASEYLELDERMLAAFTGQTPIPPITYVLILPILLVPILKFRTVVVTDRHLYVFSHKWMRSYAYEGDPYKVPIERVRLEDAASSARVDSGPKLWVMPFGPAKRSLVEVAKAAFESRAVRLRAEVKEPRDRGFGTTPM